MLNMSKEIVNINLSSNVAVSCFSLFVQRAARDNTPAFIKFGLQTLINHLSLFAEELHVTL